MIPRTTPYLSLAAALVTALASAPVLAGQDRYDDRYDRYEDDRGQVEYAKVVRSTPIYRQVRVSVPRQECHDERVVYREPRYNNGNALVGALIGGVAGHQFGSGRGNAAATAAGALIGASIASDRGGAVRERVSYEQVCNRYDDYRYEEHIEGYDVSYKLNGRVYQTRMAHDPGNRLPVRVAVSPVERY